VVEWAPTKGGKDFVKSKMTVSADGNTLTTNWMYYLSPSGGPVTDTDSQTRVGKTPAGAHAISNSWREAKQDVTPT